MDWALNGGHARNVERWAVLSQHTTAATKPRITRNRLSYTKNEQLLPTSGATLQSFVLYLRSKEALVYRALTD